LSSAIKKFLFGKKKSYPEVIKEEDIAVIDYSKQNGYMRLILTLYGSNP
jgi:hypothetical protein